MLEDGFVVPGQFMFVPQAKCDLVYKDKSCCCVDQMLDGSFVAKASTLNPRPSFMYFEAQMNGRSVSWVDKEAMHSFMSPKLIRELGIADV